MLSGVDNPILLQSPSDADLAARPPLILLHDGGGTVCSYTGLSKLDRPVYGIHNPRFDSGAPWKGGLREMARTYTELIKANVPSKRFLLGGWSLGGLLAIQIAHNFEQDETREVMGIVMIDSVCPIAWHTAVAKTAPCHPYFPPGTRADMRMRIMRSMKSSTQMVETWELPEWEQKHESPCMSRSSSIFSHSSSFTTDSESSSRAPSIFSRSPSPSRSANATPSRSQTHADLPPDFDLREYMKGCPPPTVLLKCRGRTPVPAGQPEGAVAKVDISRESSTLGWDQYDSAGQFVTLVLDSPGHHFSLFAPEHVETTSAQLRNACELLAQDHP